MNLSRIEWLQGGLTWNPITGCPGPKVSPGCAHCYAERTMNTRLRHLYGDEVPFERIHFHPERLEQPRKVKKPSRIFVGSMCDLFHDDIEVETLERVFWEFSKCPQHTFLLLTKRPERMRWWFTDGLDLGALLPNVWLGVTVCNQAEADAKIPILLDTPAAKRFVSVEPMLGPVDLTALDPTGMHVPEVREKNALTGIIRQEIHSETSWHTIKGNKLDWIICGGETGPGARPMHPGWVRSLRDQCVAAGTPFFFKGWGEWAYSRQATCAKNELVDARRELILSPDGRITSGLASYGSDAVIMRRTGKRRSGRSLNSREWNEVPHA